MGEKMAFVKTENSKKVLYEELQPDEFLERLNACPIAYLSLGTLEWHGRHMPLGADGIQAQGVFEQIAMSVGGIVLPSLFLGPDSMVYKQDKAYYGMDHFSFEEDTPQQLAGSAYYIEEELFNGLLDTIMSNLSRAGFKVVIGHGHGPSLEAFINRKQLFMDRYGLYTYNLWDLGYKDDDGLQTDHAALNETSLVMSLRPDLVNIEKLSADEIPVGIWGEDPRIAASKSYGDELIRHNMELITQNLQTIVADLSTEEKTFDYHHVKSMLRENR